MKVLVGVASVAVIAFVGYFFWGEILKLDAARVEREVRVAAAFADVAYEANVTDGDRVKVGEYCDRIREALDTWAEGDLEAVGILLKCRAAGL